MIEQIAIAQLLILMAIAIAITAMSLK